MKIGEMRKLITLRGVYYLVLTFETLVHSLSNLFRNFLEVGVLSDATICSQTRLWIGMEMIGFPLYARIKHRQWDYIVKILTKYSCAP